VTGPSADAYPFFSCKSLLLYLVPDLDPARPLPATAPADGASNGSYYGSNGASYGESTGANISVAMRQLSVKSLSQLKAMAAIEGIRGTTKNELVRQLAGAA